MSDDRTNIVLQFFLGDSEDDAVASYQFHDAEGVPRVGEKVDLWGTRDNDGNYGAMREYFGGIVTRVEHFYEQRGATSSEWRLSHFISVFLSKEEAHR